MASMSMKKKIILMIIGVLILVGAMVGVIIRNQNKQETGEESSQSLIYKTLWENDRDSIRSITLKTKVDELTLLPTGTETNGAKDWMLEGHEDWKLIHTYQNIVSISSLFQAYEMIEENVTDASRLSDFGLSDPNATLTLTMNDSTEKTMYIGNKSSDGAYAFCRMEGDNTVYACNAKYADYASFTKNSIRLAAISPINTEDGVTFTELFVQKKGERPVSIYKDDNVGVEIASGGAAYITTDMKFEEPYRNPHLEVANTLEKEYLKKLTTPTIVETIDANCTDFDQYGLGDEPEYREKITTRTGNEGAYTYVTTDYLFGKTYGDNDQYIYFREGGSSLVLGVEASCLNGRHFEPFFYVNKLMFLTPVTMVESGYVSYQGETHNFTIRREDIDESSKVAAEDVLTSYQVDGKLVNADTFTRLYRALIEIAPDYEILNETPKYDPSDKLEYSLDLNNGTTETLTFYRLSEFYYVTQIDENTWFTTNVQDIEDVGTYLNTVLESLQDAE